MGEQGSGHGAWRSRWAAIGAAVAVSLGAGGVLFASSIGRAGRRDRGHHGRHRSFACCGRVPLGATSGRSGAPTTSNLNFLAGEVVPNAVSVERPTAGPDVGRIEIAYDAYGVSGPTTDVLVDVVGCTVGAGAGGSSQVTALKAQVASLESRIAAIEAGSGEARAAHSAAVQIVSLTATDVVVRSVTIVPTANGKMGATISDAQNLAGTRGFDVAAGAPVTFRLVCDRSSGNGGITASSLTAVFAPD